MMHRRRARVLARILACGIALAACEQGADLATGEDHPQGRDASLDASDQLADAASADAEPMMDGAQDADVLLDADPLDGAFGTDAIIEDGADANSDAAGTSNEPGNMQNNVDRDAAGDAGPDAQQDAEVDAQQDAAPDAGQPDAGLVENYSCGAPVGSDVLLNTGHADDIRGLALAGNRALSIDVLGHWVLWDHTARSQIAHGELGAISASWDVGRIGLSGNLALTSVIEGGVTKAQIRSAIDGVLTTTFDVVGTPILARDGSFVWSATTDGVRVWSTGGQLLFHHAGNYADVRITTLAGKILVGGGPAGSSLVETIEVPSGNVSTTSFSGTFSRWYSDGQGFVTQNGSALRAYATGQPSAHLIVAPSEDIAETGGYGQYWWYFSAGQLTIHRFGVAAAVATVPPDSRGLRPRASQGALALFGGTIVDLRSDQPRLVSGAWAPDVSVADGTFAFDNTSGSFLTPNFDGLVAMNAIDGTGTATTLGCGRAFSVATTARGTTFVATADGIIRVFQLRTNTTPAYIASIPFYAQSVGSGADGSALVAKGRSELKAWSFQPIAVFGTWPLSVDFSVARNASRLGRISCAAECAAVLSDLDGSKPTTVLPAGANASSKISLSPNGQRFAISSPTAQTLIIFEGTAPVGACDGTALGWIDDNSLLIRRADALIVTNASGDELRTLAPVASLDFASVDSSRFFSRKTKTVYSASTGKLVWQGVTDALRFQLISEHVITSDLGGGWAIGVEGPRIRAEVVP